MPAKFLKRIWERMTHCLTGHSLHLRSVSRSVRRNSPEFFKKLLCAVEPVLQLQPVAGLLVRWEEGRWRYPGSGMGSDRGTSSHPEQWGAAALRLPRRFEISELIKSWAKAGLGCQTAGWPLGSGGVCVKQCLPVPAWGRAWASQWQRGPLRWNVCHLLTHGLQLVFHICACLSIFLCSLCCSVSQSLV